MWFFTSCKPIIYVPYTWVNVSDGASEHVKVVMDNWKIVHKGVKSTL